MKTRTEKEIFELIHQFAKGDDRIRLVIMNGSRANPHVQKDIFQDYDIACFVTHVQPYLHEEKVIPFFGDTMVVEQPNLGPWPPDDADGSYHNYNMQFLDGNRMDLSFFHIDKWEDLGKDSLSVVLIDKDNLCSGLPQASEKSYFLTEPTQDLFTGCCSAFYFALGSHIPKTIWRKQLPLLKFYIEGWLREPMGLMMSWEIGARIGYEHNLGAKGKYLEKYLKPETWEQYRQTYVDGDFENIWASLFLFHEIFTGLAAVVAKKHNFLFSRKNSDDVLAFLHHVRTLPDDGEEIY